MEDLPMWLQYYPRNLFEVINRSGMTIDLNIVNIRFKRFIIKDQINPIFGTCSNTIIYLQGLEQLQKVSLNTFIPPLWTLEN